MTTAITSSRRGSESAGSGGGAAAAVHWRKWVRLTWPALMRLHAAVSDDWYCDSSTTYTTLKTLRSPTSSGTTRRSAGLDCVKRPGPVATIAGSGARSTAELRTHALEGSVSGEGAKGRCYCSSYEADSNAPLLLLLLLEISLELLRNPSGRCWPRCCCDAHGTGRARETHTRESNWACAMRASALWSVRQQWCSPRMPCDGNVVE